jgi:predicted NBD/HSP70 family sugar kinase
MLYSVLQRWARILSPSIRPNANCNALSIGHTIVECNGRECTCGRQGCLEAYAAGPALVQQYNLRTGKLGVTGKEIAEAAQARHDVAIKVIEMHRLAWLWPEQRD